MEDESSVLDELVLLALLFLASGFGGEGVDGKRWLLLDEDVGMAL